jgi:hypothetical protein
MKRFMKLAALVAGIHLPLATLSIVGGFYSFKENFDVSASEIGWIDNLIMGAPFVLAQPLVSIMTLDDLQCLPHGVEGTMALLVMNSLVWGIVGATVITTLGTLRKNRSPTFLGKSGL